MLATQEQVYYGSIKSYNSEKGWGHIECDQTRQIYGKDMFVLRSQLSGARVAKGDQVEFRVRQGQQGPEATGVRVLSQGPGGCPAPGGCMPPGFGMGPAPGTLPADLTACGMAGPCAAAGPGPLAGSPVAGAPCWGAGAGQAWAGCQAGCGQLWAGGCAGPCAAACVGACAGAAPAVPAAGPFTGVVRAFSPENGWGHIASEQAQQIFGRDVLLLQSALAGGVAQEGDNVRFTVRMEQEGPVAAEVQVLSTALGGPPLAAAPQQWAAPALQQQGYAWPPAMPGAQMWGTTQVEPQPGGAAPNGAMPGGCTMPGSAEGLVPGAAMPNGTLVPSPPPLWGAGAPQHDWSGCAQLGQPQPPAPCAGAACAGGFGGHLWGAQAGAPQPAPPGACGAPAGTAAPGAEKQVFFGIVKAFDEEKGWGHICCDVTRQMFGKDMFVLRSSLHGTKISAGDEVQFALRQGLRGVEATEVRPLSRGVVVSPDEAAGREFVGTLKMFDSTKGWGFLECDESRQLYGKDIFVHKREFPKGCTPDNGDRLRFVVERGRDARPEARRVTLDLPLDGSGQAPTPAIPAIAGAADEGAGGAGAEMQTGAGAEQLGPEMPQYNAARAPEVGFAERASPY